MDENSLEELEALYRKSIPSTRAQPSENISEAILKSASDQLIKKTTSTVVSLEEFRAARLRWSGLSIAAGLALGVLTSFSINDADPVNVGFSKSDVRFMGSPVTAGEEKTFNDLSAPEMQSAIAEFVLLGEIDKAEILIKEYRRRWP